MKLKRLISAIVAVGMMVTMLPVSAVTAFAEGNGASYDCGKDGANVTCTLKQNNSDTENPTYTLTISGEGEMTDYANVSEVPWYSEYMGKVTKGVVESGITHLGARTFVVAKNLTSVELPEGLLSIGASCFNQSGLTSIQFPSSLKEIDDNAFWHGNLSGNVYIPDSVTRIGVHAFDQCPITSINLPKDLQTLGGGALKETKITEMPEIPAAIKNIDGVFMSCYNLTDVAIPDTVTSLGTHAFENCTNLKSVVIPSSVTTMASNAFKDCTSLKTIHYNGTKAQWEALKASMGAGNTVLDNITPEFISAKLTTDIGEKTFVVGTPVEFTFSTVANSDAGIMVKGTSNFSDTDAIEKLEYYEVKDRNWYELKGDFGAGTGFPMMDATSKFRVTFKKAGTYTFTAFMEKVDGTGTLCETNVEFTVREKAPNLTVTGGTVVSVMDGENDITEEAHIVTTGNTVTATIPEGSIVTVTFDDSILKDSGSNFDQWKITSKESLLVPGTDTTVNPKNSTITFVMPKGGVEIEAMTKDATIEDDSSEALGIAAAVVTGAVGTAVLTYQGYMLGTELYLTYLLPAGAAIPANRAELAMLVWQEAGKPEPAAPVALDAADDVKALTWAVETGLMDDADKNGETLAADASVSRIDVIKTWKKAQEMK